jgi:hypothetical protein
VPFDHARAVGFRDIDKPAVVSDEADVAALNFPPCGVFKAAVTCLQWSSVALHALGPAPNETAICSGHSVIRLDAGRCTTEGTPCRPQSRETFTRGATYGLSAICDTNMTQGGVCEKRG